MKGLTKIGIIAVMLLALFLIAMPVFADNTTALSPGTMADNASTGSVAWVNPDNAKASDNVYTTATNSPGVFARESHTLTATNFGFSIPTGATINGILVEVERKASANDGNYQIVADLLAQLLKAGGGVGTDKHIVGSPYWPTSDTYISYGNSSDLWGTTWTVSQINTNDFGFIFRLGFGTYEGLVGSVDHIRITVYYTNATAPTINTVKFISTNCPTCDHRIVITATDVNSNLDGCFVGSTFIHNNTNGQCEINISDTTTNGIIYCNDSLNANVSYAFNFLFTDKGISQNTSATKTEATQTFKRDDTLTNNAAGQINYSVNLSTPAGFSATVFGGSFSGTLNNAGVASLNTNWNGDWLTTNTNQYSQNTSGTKTEARIDFNGTSSWTASASLPNSTTFTYDLGTADVGGTCSGDTWILGNTGTITGITASGTKTDIFKAYADCITTSAYAGWVVNTTSSLTLASQTVSNSATLTSLFTGTLSTVGWTTTAEGTSCWTSGTQTLSGTANVLTTGTSITASQTGDCISTEVKGTEQYIFNSSATSTESIQYFWNQTYFNVTNDDTYAFTSVDISSLCSNTLSANIGTGTNKITTNCTHDSFSGDWIGNVVKQNSQNSSGTKTNARVDFNGTASWTALATLPNAIDFTFDLGTASQGSCTGMTWIAGNTGTINGITASGTGSAQYQFYGDCIGEGAKTTESQLANNSQSHTLSLQFILNQTQAILTELSGLALSNVDALGYCPNNGTQSLSASQAKTILNCSYVQDSGGFLTSILKGKESWLSNLSAASNETIQYFFNQTHLNVTNPFAFTFNNVDLTSQCSNTGTANVGAGTSKVTANCSFDSFSGNWIASINGSEAQDTAHTSEAGGQIYTRMSVNFTVAALPAAANIALSTRCRAGWTQNITTLTISGSINNVLFGCNSSGVITKSQKQWNISDSNITVGANSTGFIEILTNNTDSLSFSSVLINASSGSLIPSGYALNDSETYTINLANGNFNLRNVTIKTSSPYVIEKDAAAADCIGYAFYSKYCIKQTITDLGSGQTKREYWIKSFINNTNNITKSYKIFYQMPVSRFADWPYRDAGSVTYTAGSSSTNLSLSSDGSYVTLLVDTSHGNSSIEQGVHTVEIYYSRTTTVGLSPGGGGGGGGGEPYPIIQIITIKAGDWTQNPSLIQKLGKSGDIFTESIVLGNPNPYNITVKLFFQQLENDPSWKWAKFINGNFRLTEKEITLMPGSSASPYRKEVEFEVIVPQDVGEYLYQFNIISSDLNNSGYQATRFSVDSRPAFSFFQAIVSFAEGGIHFPKPILGVSFIPTTWLLLGFMVLVLIGILYRIYKKN